MKTHNILNIRFKEVTSLEGLEVGYQLYNTANNITEFVTKIGLDDYIKYGYRLRYVLNNGQSPTLPDRNVYVAMLFKVDQSWIKN